MCAWMLFALRRTNVAVSFSPLNSSSSVHYYFNVLFFTLCQSHETLNICTRVVCMYDRFGQPHTTRGSREEARKVRGSKGSM